MWGSVWCEGWRNMCVEWGSVWCEGWRNMCVEWGSVWCEGWVTRPGPRYVCSGQTIGRLCPHTALPDG